MNSARQQFCDFLLDSRRVKSLGLDDIAYTTRIPARSLALLEAGEFEALPADVFVRGFVRAYADCVGIDADDAVSRYAACGLAAAPVCSEQAERLAASMSRNEAATNPPEAGAGDLGPRSDGIPRVRRTFLPTEPGDGESRRGPLTLAVIVLAIVATLAMSYLLRRPSQSSDGITLAPTIHSPDSPLCASGLPFRRG